MERRLYRSSRDRMISGVCGGLGEYLQIDATLVRLGMAALAFVSCGTVFMLYLIAIIIIPEAPMSYTRRTEKPYTQDSDFREEAEDLYEASPKPSEDQEPPVK